MLNRKSPETLAANLTIIGQGMQETVSIVYTNRTLAQINEKTAALQDDDKAADAFWVNRELFLFVVKEFNGQMPTHAGIIELEDNWPGAVAGIFQKFHEVRRVEVVKN